MAAPAVKLADSEDEQESPPGGGSLNARYEALDAMSRASLAGEAQRLKETSLPLPSLPMDEGEDGKLSRTASFELQYDALDAGNAVAAVAVASPRGSVTTPGSCSMKAAKAPGFHAVDVASMLQQRAEWLDRLGSDALLRSEDLSDASSDWGGSDDSGGEQPAPQDSPPEQQKGKPKGFMLVACTKMESHVHEEHIDFQAAKRRFSDVQAESKTAAGMEAPGRRLQRLRGEAKAFCSWAESRPETALPQGREVGQLARDAKDVASLVQSVAVGGLPKAVWLPPSERLDAAAVQQLLRMGRLQQSQGRAQLPRNEEAPLSYQLSAKEAGWLAAPEALAFQQLEKRVQLLKSALGSAIPDTSLTGVVSKLHRRLDSLQAASSDEACERLRTSVQLLSAEIDVAAAEAKHLEALETEERQGDLGADMATEASAADHVVRMHHQLAGLDRVALCVADISEKLGEQEWENRQVAQFATEIACAEARMQEIGQMLRAAATAAEQMRQAAETGREQLQRNLTALEAKLTMHSRTKGR